MTDPVRNLPIQSSNYKITWIENKQDTKTKLATYLLFGLALMNVLFFLNIFFILINVIKPVNNIKERKNSWKDHP